MERILTERDFRKSSRHKQIKWKKCGKAPRKIYITIPDFSLSFQTCKFNCLVNIYTWVSNAHSKPQKSKAELLILLPKTVLFTTLPVSVDANSILPVTWASYLDVSLTSNYFHILNPMYHQLIDSSFKKYPISNHFSPSHHFTNISLVWATIISHLR